MKKITIFANGLVSSKKINCSSNETIIAADGGALHCLKLGITPHVVIGDFDSLSEEDLLALEADRVNLIRHPVDKDDTDLKLALDYAAALGGTELTLYGILGGRWDMTFANMLLLASPEYAGITFKILDGNTTVYILRGGESLMLQGEPGMIVSVIPFTEPVFGLTYQGLKWPLENAELPIGTPRGVSNIMTADQAKISLQHGTLLVFSINLVD